MIDRLLLFLLLCIAGALLLAGFVIMGSIDGLQSYPQADPTIYYDIAPRY